MPNAAPPLAAKRASGSRASSLARSPVVSQTCTVGPGSGGGGGGGGAEVELPHAHAYTPATTSHAQRTMTLRSPLPALPAGILRELPVQVSLRLRDRHQRSGNAVHRRLAGRQRLQLGRLRHDRVVQGSPARQIEPALAFEHEFAPPLEPHRIAERG